LISFLSYYVDLIEQELGLNNMLETDKVKWGKWRNGGKRI
jgi:hypothetical protein